MSLGKAIYSILNVSAVTTLATGGIFPSRARQGAVAPYLVYRINDVIAHETKGGVSDVDHFFIIIEAYAKTYSAVEALSLQVRTTLDGYSGTANGVVVDTIVFEDKSDLFDDNAETYSQEIDFMVRINN